MAEFKTFISRREYKIINKRLRRGLTVHPRRLLCSKRPYGYRKTTIDKSQP